MRRLAHLGSSLLLSLTGWSGTDRPCLPRVEIGSSAIAIGIGLFGFEFLVVSLENLGMFLVDIVDIVALFVVGVLHLICERPFRCPIIKVINIIP